MNQKDISLLGLEVMYQDVPKIGKSSLERLKTAQKRKNHVTQCNYKQYVLQYPSTGLSRPHK